MSFTDVFGVQTVPPSEYSLATYTIAANNTFYWPEQYSGTGLLLAKITRLDVTAPALELTLPPADETSVGQDILFSNIGASTVTIKDAAGGVVTTIGAGVSKYLYVFDNSTPAGSWYSLTFGAGSNSVDAAALAGFGLKAISSQLVTNVPNATINANYTITASDRSKAFDITTGTITVSLPQASVVDDGFWVAIRNSSIGSADIEGYLAETINGGLTFTLGPNESALFYCNGASWITVGYGRDVNFVFSEYVVNAAAGNVTLSSSDVSGRMIRVSGTAVANFTVTLPTIDNIYFVIVESGMGGFTVTFKTAIGTGVTLSANQNVALYSDGTNVNFAVTTAAVSSIDLNDGSAVSPSLRFLLDADTGIFRVGANTLGITANGVQVAQFDPLGLTGSVVFAPVGTIAATTVAGALAELDTEKVAKAGDTMTGDLTFSGSGRRIVGDMSDATVANRLFFQNSVVNGVGGVSVIPNGTSVVSAVNAFNNSAPANSSVAQLIVNGTVVAVNSTITGAGVTLPLTFQIAGAEVGRFSTAGLFGIGGTPVSKTHVFAASNDGIRLTSTDGTTFQGVLYNTNNNQMTIGTVTNHPIEFFVNNTSIARIDTSGNVRLRTATGGLGYETGSGGTVVQATSKATGVTLNRPTGQITMNAAALASNTTVTFQILNSVIAAQDVLIVNHVSGGTGGAYLVWISGVGGGAANISVRNITGGSLSEAIVLGFAVIKGATA